MNYTNTLYWQRMAIALARACMQTVLPYWIVNSGTLEYVLGFVFYGSCATNRGRVGRIRRFLVSFTFGVSSLIAAGHATIR